MSIAEIPPSEASDPNWDWKEDRAFLEELNQDLRRLARARIRTGIRAISVSSLVQESLVRLLNAKCLRHPEDRSYLYSLAARAMRFVIVDQIRAQQALKRPQNPISSDMDLLMGRVQSNNIDVLAIHEALEKLSITHPRHAQIVEMKFFAGCTMPEIAEHFNLGLSTVEQDWKQAKKFLTKFLSV